MPVPAPIFTSDLAFQASLADIDFWRPHIDALLRRHGLAGSDLSNAGYTAGVGGTYPTFLCDDVVVKFFGHVPAWRQSFKAEYAAHTLLATVPEITTPHLLAAGELTEKAEAAWPYLITSRMAGVAWQDAQLSNAEKLATAQDLGRLLRRVHALPTSDIASHDDWASLDIVEAARRSSLPVRFLSQIDAYLAATGPLDAVVVHGDIMYRHVFVEKGRLSGVIDWGDMMVTDPHYEFAKLHLDLFDGDQALLVAFLDASDWPVGPDFARKAMALAFHRQAHGLVQHTSMDVFYRLPKLVPLAEIATLDELADALFAV